MVESRLTFNIGYCLWMDNIKRQISYVHKQIFLKIKNVSEKNIFLIGEKSTALGQEKYPKQQKSVQHLHFQNDSCNSGPTWAGQCIPERGHLFFRIWRSCCNIFLPKKENLISLYQPQWGKIFAKGELLFFLCLFVLKQTILSIQKDEEIHFDYSLNM